ncbi:hypothetical protein O181_081389 [Austropuccinia psidii MF-1]|uniref:Uncharacterized protein n=1 Tax=Austropuccinia psidii MF-1 TaxID=1389203 RepID=A0A9Q3IK33_9BASI|nr:hypothetical protein [Austropuccinia psidii MF-1]
MPKEYDCNTHSQFQLFTPTFPASNSTPASYPAVSSLISKQKLIQLPSGSDLPMTLFKPPSSLIKILDQLFSGIKRSPMANQPITFGPPHPQDPLSMPGTSLQTRSLSHLNPFRPIPLLEDCSRMIWD